MTEPNVAPMRAADVLAYADLYPPDERRGSSAPLIPESGVHCGRPLIYPMPADDLPAFLRERARATGCRFFGVVFAFDLERAEGRRYSSARFEVRLNDQRTVAVQIHADGDALGILFGSGRTEPASPAAARAVFASAGRPGWLPRLASYAGHARPRITGTQSHAFSWAYDDPRGDTLIPEAFAMHAIVEAPDDVTELGGSLLVDVMLVRGGWRGRPAPATLRKAIGFREPLPGVAAPALGPAVRLCVAADVEAYGDRPNPLAELTQLQLVEVLASARRRAGINDREVHLQPQGDEVFAILPVGIDESRVIPNFVEGLAAALRAVNAGAPADRLRLRVAMHRGLMKEGPSGWIGHAAVAVHRILDAAPLRSALAANPAVDFVLGVPDVLYQDVLVHSYEALRGEDFEEITVEVPEKRFREHAWVYLPRYTGQSGQT